MRQTCKLDNETNCTVTFSSVSVTVTKKWNFLILQKFTDADEIYEIFPDFLLEKVVFLAENLGFFFREIVTAILLIATNGLYRIQWKCSHYATATTSPILTQAIKAKTNRNRNQ